MADVAARAGVSKALVSIVFRGAPGASPENREKVMRAAEELSYRPDHRARLLGGRGRTRTVGVLFGLNQEFHGRIVEHLYGAADASDYDLALGATTGSRSEWQSLGALLELRCDGIVLVAPKMPEAEIEDLARQVPVVLVSRGMRSTTVDVVRTDDEAGEGLAVEHLHGLGHTRIAHVDGGRLAGATERRRGYRTTMRRLGLGEQVCIVPGGQTEERGEKALEVLLQDGLPSAVSVYNDHCAVGMVSAARKRGLAIPGDLSVVGYDNNHLAELSSFALTTIAQDVPHLAGTALNLVQRRIAEPDAEAREVVLPPRLVTRETAAPPSPR